VLAFFCVRFLDHVYFVIEMIAARHRQATTPLRIGSHTMAPHPHPHAQHQQQPQQPPQQHSHLSPKHQQQPQCHQMVAHQQMLSNGQHPPIGNVRPAHNEHFICLELQKLHKEKERLLQEQEAINCRVNVFDLKPFICNQQAKRKLRHFNVVLFVFCCFKLERL
jgi:hypothetical protein